MAGNLGADLRGGYSLGPGQETLTRVFSVRDDPYQQERNNLLPFLQGQMMNAASRRGPNLPSFGNFMSRVGGQARLGPQASTGPIWNEDQIQQRVNAARALTDAQRDTTINKTKQSLGQKGYATANSPLLMQLGEQQRGMAMMANAANENNLRWQSALGNAEYMQKGQIANQQAWANYMNDDRERRRIASAAWMQDRQRAQSAYDAEGPLGFADAIMRLLQATAPREKQLGQLQNQETYTALRRIANI